MKKKALVIATIGGFLPVSEIHNAKLLIELGYEVHYASNFNNRIYEFDEQKLVDMGIVLHQVDFSKNPYQFVQLAKCVAKVRAIIKTEGIDVVHCHTPVGGVVGRLSALGLKESRPYVIYTAHGFHFYKGASIVNWLIYYPVEYILSKFTNCLITINEEDFGRAQKMLCRKCVRIPGVGINLERFQPREKGEHKGFSIISVGELNKNKNHSTVIKAIASLQDADIHYNIYGNGTLKGELEELIRAHGLEKQVELKGFHTRIEEPLAEADCCIFPSFREGLGLAALEAMACKVPLIVADNRGTREFAYHEENCLVCEPASVEQFANAIRRIKEDKVFADNLAECAQQTVQNFSVNKTREIMRSVYEEI